MKIRPVILCGGEGTRLWSNSKKHQAKQFIDFGNWTLLDKTLERVKISMFDAPIISTNSKYLKQVKIHLKALNLQRLAIKSNQEVTTTPSSFQLLFQISDQFLSP